MPSNFLNIIMINKYYKKLTIFNPEFFKEKWFSNSENLCGEFELRNRLKDLANIAKKVGKLYYWVFL